MDRGCLCEGCFNYLVEQLVEVHDDKILIVDEVSVSHNVPEIEIPYKHENGNTYYKSISPDANYCCHCGTEV